MHSRLRRNAQTSFVHARSPLYSYYAYKLLGTVCPRTDIYRIALRPIYRKSKFSRISRIWNCWGNYFSENFDGISGAESGGAGGGAAARPPGFESGGVLSIFHFLSKPYTLSYKDDLLYTVVLYVRVHSILVNCLQVLKQLKLVNGT